MKILEKKSVEVNFTESLLRMAADDVEGNQKKVLFSFLTDRKALPPNLSYLIIVAPPLPSSPLPLLLPSLLLLVLLLLF